MFVRFMCVFVFDDHVDLGSGETAAHDLAFGEMRADVEGAGSFIEELEGHTGVNQCAEQHIAADAGETFEITNAHE
jgi:hypothetical protein